MAYEKDPDEIGALWVKDGRKGEYMTGTINGVKVVCFKNDRWKAGGNLPMWRVLKSKPRESGNDGGNTNEVGFVTTPSDDGVPF